MIDRELVLIQVAAELYRRSFYEFFVASSKILYPSVEWQYNWHFEYIADILQSEVERIINKKEKTKDLIINLPFRSGKSIQLSQIFPVWCWLKDPSMAIMQISHSELLSVKHSHASLMLLECEWFRKLFPELELRPDSKAKANYMNTLGGKRISFGIGSGIIGEGCNIQIIDDINNPSDSLAGMAGINETYTDTLYSRLNNPSVDLRIILQQRTNENDICGYLLKKNPDKYHHICLPAKIDNNISPEELKYNYIDGLFWHDRFTEAVLLDYQQTLGSKAFSGQLMQKPQSEQGTIIQRKWFKIMSYADFKLIEQHIQWSAFIDSAYTSSQKNDSTAVIIAGKYNNCLYVLKSFNFWLGFPELIARLKSIEIQYGIRMFFIEPKASGLSIKQQLARDGINIKESANPDKDKVTRVNAVTPIIEAGRVILIEDTTNETLLAECAAFPFGTDNLVDSLTIAISTLLNKNIGKYHLT